MPFSPVRPERQHPKPSVKLISFHFFIANFDQNDCRAIDFLLGRLSGVAGAKISGVAPNCKAKPCFRVCDSFFTISIDVTAKTLS